MENKQIKGIVFAAMMAAVVAVATLVIRIPVSVTGAYINAGDAVIYIAAYALSVRHSALAAGLGSMVADIIAGAGIYILPTLIIKGIMGFAASAIIRKNPDKKRFITASIISGAIMVIGYGVFEWIVFGGSVALATLVGNLIQWVGGVIIGFVLYFGIKRMPKEILPKYYL